MALSSVFSSVYVVMDVSLLVLLPTSRWKKEHSWMSVLKGMPILPRLISSSVTIADHAGQMIREIMAKGDLGVITKEHAKDLQTEADIACQKCIVSSLSAQFPKLTIIGEEDIDCSEKVTPVNLENVQPLDLTCPPMYEDLQEEDVVVWVDPLDGTAEYTQGLLDHVTVLIGIASKGKAIGGVIHQPYYNYKNPGEALGRTIWAVTGGKVGGMDIVPPPEEGCIVTTTRSHSSSTVNDALESLKPTEVLRVGGAGHKILLLLDGRAHVYVFASPGCKKWDTCAPQAVLEAAGGKLTDINGNPIPYGADVTYRNSSGVLATAPGQDLQNFLAMIPQHVKDNLKA